jgi:UDPglucose 6-dehydrogenase
MCTDNDGAKMGILAEGRLPIYEPGLGSVVDHNLRAQRLSFTSDPGEAVRFGDGIFICVGTPPLPNGEADLARLGIDPGNHEPSLILDGRNFLEGEAIKALGFEY